MNRLTRKIKGYYSVDLRTCLPMEYEQIENSNACVDKLGKLEDIEEQLGVDLITLFKAKNNGFYVKSYCINRGEISFVLKTDILYVDLMSWLIHTDYDNLFYVDFKDYGKTWALTKEELEDEI